MEKAQDLLNLLLNPTQLLVKNEAREIDDLISKYPFFQSAHQLKLLAESRSDYLSNEYLQVAAIYAGDRFKLQQSLNSFQTTFSEEKETRVEPKPGKKSQSREKEMEELARLTLSEAVMQKNTNYLAEEADSLSEENEDSAKMNFESWIKSLKREKSSNPAKTGNQRKKKNTGKSKDSIGLIESFINKDSKPRQKKIPIYNPSKMAQKSVEEPGDLVSETLAKINAKQGHYTKAIKMYEQLSLLYPEKSNYFAGQIRELEEKRKE